jgi:hypothetical protein
MKRVQTVMSSGVCLLVFASGSSLGTELTFNIDGFGNGTNMSQDYGDRVVMLDDGDFHYDEHGEGFTPNVTVSYTTSEGQDPSHWNTGYGDLVHIYYENTDHNGQGEIVITADYGYEVVLYGFDMSAYGNVFSEDPTIDGVRVMGCSSTAYFDQADAVISETTHTSFDFSGAPIQSRELRVQFFSGNLGNLSDDISFDNVRFGQVAVDPEVIDCPSDFALPVCVLDFFDVSAFLGLFNAGDMQADLTGDGLLDFFDVSAFLSEFSAGCGAK